MDREASAEVESFLDQHQDAALSRLAIGPHARPELAEDLLHETFLCGHTV